MIEVLLARLGSAALAVFGVCTLVFLLIHLVPGDPVEVMLGEGASAADRGALRAALGLVNVVLNLILIPQLGAMGAIIGTGISIMGIIVLEYWFAFRCVSLVFPTGFLLKTLFASMVALVASRCIALYDWFTLFLNAAIFGIIFLAVIFFVKPFSAEDRDKISQLNFILGKLLRHFSK